MEAVKEKNLDKTQLEEYRDDLSNLYASMHLELAGLEKEEAMFFLFAKQKEPTLTDVSVKRGWRAMPEGQRMIQLSHEVKACEKLLSSIKSRIYAQY